MIFRAIRPAWPLWATVSCILVAYVIAAFIAAYPTRARLKLVPGEVVELSVFRLFDHNLQFELNFTAVGFAQRPELGSWLAQHDEGKRLLRLRPGAEVLIDVTANSRSVRYEAMPLSSYGGGFRTRSMTSDLSVEPGVWPWPPSGSSALPLPRGFTHLVFRVAAVEPPLVGEVVQLSIQPLGGFNVCYGPACSLVPGLLLWPVFLTAQIVWAWMIAFGVLDRLRRAWMRSLESMRR